MLTLDEEVVQFISDQSAVLAVSSDLWTVSEIHLPSVLVLIQRMLLFIAKVFHSYINHYVPVSLTLQRSVTMVMPVSLGLVGTTLV